MAQFFGTASDDVLNGTAEHDRFDLSQGGSDIAHGARGDDHFFLGGAFNAAGIIDGGTGNDTLVLAGNYNVTFGQDTLRSVETIRLTDGFDYSLALDEATVGRAKTFTVDGSHLTTGAVFLNALPETDGTLIFAGGGQADTLFSGSGAVTFDGAGGDDAVGLSGDVGAETSLRGGTGFDTLGLGEVVLALASFNPASWGFERLELGAELVGTDADDHWNFSGVTIDGEPFITGMGGDDVMIGADDHFNRFYGMAGDDRLYGGDSVDEMTGGTGHNRLFGGGGDDNLGNFAVLSDGAGRTLMDGGEGNDDLAADNGAYRVYGGNGDDEIAVREAVVRDGWLLGGGGLDTLVLSAGGISFAGILFYVDSFDAEASGIESLIGGMVEGNNRNNAIDFSGFTVLSDFGVIVSGFGGEDYLAGTYRHDVLDGGAGDDILNGTAGDDTLSGGFGDDGLTGGLGVDSLAGGEGPDVYSYFAVMESTGVAYDKIEGFNAVEGDTIDLWFDVEVVREHVTAGSLSAASFDVDLAAAIGADQLAGHEAVLFTPDAGSLAGLTFLIIDANNTSGYQPGQDLVIEMTHLTGDLSPTDFT